MTRSRLLIAPAALALLSAPALAQQAAPAPGQGAKFFDATDTNKDGALTQEEVAARFEQLQELRRTRQQGGGMP